MTAGEPEGDCGGFPAGHYYSPIPDWKATEVDAERIFRDRDAIPGIDLNAIGQLATLRTLGAAYKAGFDWPDERSPDRRYFCNNPVYGHSSAAVLYAIMATARPRRIVEVGSGFSSALMLDFNQYHGGNVDLTFVEPFPKRLKSLLREADPKASKIVETPVQAVPVKDFETLRASDVLFIDSTHVAKIGSDVLYLYHEVLPALASGVIVHIHDILWPFEYPRNWVLKNRWAWNEVYLLHSFLQFNDQFEIMFFNSFISRKHNDEAAAHLPVLATQPGGSIWIRRK